MYTHTGSTQLLNHFSITQLRSKSLRHLIHYTRPDPKFPTLRAATIPYAPLPNKNKKPHTHRIAPTDCRDVVTSLTWFRHQIAKAIECDGILDVAELLWNKFLKSLAELDSESNSGSITISVFKSSIKALVSDFEAIKDVVNERDIMPEPYSYSETINLLYKLNDALADCRVFTHECMELNNVISRFNFRRFTFVAKVKSRLTKLKQELEQLPQQPIGNPRTKTEFTGSGPKVPSAKVFGFDEQLKEVNEELLQAGGSSSSNAGELRAIGVVGIAGVGKTTLVQKVLESKEVKQKFNHILWLPFSLSVEEEQYSKFSNFTGLTWFSKFSNLFVFTPMTCEILKNRRGIR